MCTAPQAIRVHWTNDFKHSSVVDPKVAHYNTQTALNDAVKAGCDAHDANNVDQAAAEWGRAVALAATLGHDKMLARLGRLVDIDGDPADGAVRVKKSLLPSEVFSAVMCSVRSTRSPDSGAQQTIREPATGPDRTCPLCAYVSPSTAAFCMKCGYSLARPHDNQRHADPYYRHRTGHAAAHAGPWKRKEHNAQDANGVTHRTTARDRYRVRNHPAGVHPGARHRRHGAHPRSFGHPPTHPRAGRARAGQQRGNQEFPGR